jgi:hypothetical protein
VKQDSTPMVTGPPLEEEVELEVEVVPHAASASTSTRQPEAIRRNPCRPLLFP